jgi:outer membrane protein TolC
VVGTFLAAVVAAVAAEPPPGVPLDEVPALAEDAWDAGAGAAWAARADADRAAKRYVNVGPDMIEFQVQAGNPAGDQFTGWLDVPLWTGVHRRRAWEAAAEAAEASGASARSTYVDTVVEAWTRWWWAEVVRRHLDLWAADVERDLAILDAAARARLVAPIDVADLRAELGTIKSEAITAEATSRAAEAEVEALLGHGVELAEVGDPDLIPIPSGDPWAPLVARAAAHPAVVAAEAAHAAAEADVKALTAADAPSVQAGAMTLRNNDLAQPGSLAGPFVPLAFAGIAVPLQHQDRAKRRAAKGEAEATELEAAWMLDRVMGDLRARSAAFVATRERVLRLDREVIVPLEEREVTVRAAFREGLVTADRLVHARRDHHEAEHQRLEALAELIASAVRARAVALAMDRGEEPR